MTGFVSKLCGYNYEGEYVTATAIKNGTFCYLNDNKMTKTNADKDTKMIVYEKTKLNQTFALRCFVTSVGSDAVYFVETGADINTSSAYDTSDYEIPQNIKCRAHRIIVRDEIIFTVDGATYESVSEGDTISPVADGKIARRNYDNLTVKIVLAQMDPVATDDPEANPVTVPFTVSCSSDPRFTEEYVSVSDTHRKFNSYGTHTTTVVEGDCSLSTAGTAIYKGTITYQITQGSVKIESSVAL